MGKCGLQLEREESGSCDSTPGASELVVGTAYFFVFCRVYCFKAWCLNISVLIYRGRYILYFSPTYQYRNYV